MKIQKTTWGQIEWLHGNDAAGANSIVSVGIATVDPFVAQKRHIHYQHDQYIYIIQGVGTDIINGSVRDFQAGMFYHIPPNVTHQLINTGELPVKHILVTVYTPRQNSAGIELPDIDNFSNLLYAAVEAIRGRIQGSVTPPITIFDDMGNLVWQAGQFPAYCMEHCEPNKTPSKCPCFHRCSSNRGPDEKKNIFVCSKGITVVKTPIIYKDHNLGCIFCGHVLLGNESASDEIDMYDTPQGTMMAISRWTSNVAESIVSFCCFSAMRDNLDIKENLIQQKNREREALQNDLKNMQSTVTNLRINRHFLFNTLNAIAGQALIGNKNAAYSAITDLAKMFRYSTSTDLRIVKLKEELEYLRTYIHMQQLRFGDSLKAELVCPEEVLGVTVPFNFLQTFVENAFTHGFADFYGEKHLKLIIERKLNRLIIKIINNGEPLDRHTIDRVINSLGNESGHGLSLSYAKLKSVYGNDFSVDLSSDAVHGTCISINIPFTEKGDSNAEGNNS